MTQRIQYLCKREIEREKHEKGKKKGIIFIMNSGILLLCTQLLETSWLMVAMLSNETN